MKPVEPTAAFAVRTAKGEQRKIRSFLEQIEKLDVRLEDLPPPSVRALDEADKFLQRYLDLLDRETPTHEQLQGVMEALAGIDKVVKNARAEVLKSLGWRPERPAPGDGANSGSGASKRGKPRPGRKGKEGDNVIAFPGPGRKPVS
jgi:hypothetical protein